MSIPFTRPAAFVGAIGSISGSTITVASTPGWTANQFVYGVNSSGATGETSKTYYAIVGPKITALANPVSVTNGSTAVTGSGFSSIAGGDELLVNGLAYPVQTVSGDTSLTLTRNYTGATASGLSASYDHSPKEGCYYTVTASGSNTVTVNLNGDSLGMVAAGTTVSLIPYWTLITAFPSSDAGVSFITTTNPKTLGTLILLPDLQSAGTNLSTSASYYYINGAWTLFGGTSATPPNDTILPPTTYFILRNPALSTASTTFTPGGGVYMNRITAQLDVQASAPQDNAVALPRPTAVTLDQLDLISSGGFVSGTNAKNPGDFLLTYDNTLAGTNKAASNVYYNLSGIWYSSNGASNVGSTVVIPYGTGLTIRKAANGTGSTAFWQNTRSF